MQQQQIVILTGERHISAQTAIMGRLRHLGPLAVLGYLAARRNALAQRALARIRREIAPVD